MSGTEIFWHVGLPKCASTTLQINVFARLRNIRYLGSFPTGNLGKTSAPDFNREIPYLMDSELRAFYQLLLQCDGFAASRAERQKRFRVILDRYACNLPLIFSHEALTARFFSNPDLGAKARYLRELGGGFRIIIVLRRQQDVIRSQYRDQPYDPACITGRRFLGIDDWIRADMARGGLGFVQSLDYGRLLGGYRDLFGHDSVGVFLFEELVSDPTLFAGRLGQFLGIDPHEVYEGLQRPSENPGITTRFHWIRRWEREFLCRLPARVSRSEMMRQSMNALREWSYGGKKMSVRIGEGVLRKLEERFRASNRSLEVLLKRDLGSLGYWV